MQNIVLNSTIKLKHSLMNVKHQDPVVSRNCLDSSKTKVVYCSPETEEIVINSQNAILLDSPGGSSVDPVNPCSED